MTEFRFDEVGLSVLLRSPGGSVARDLARRAIRVESSAKLHASGRPGPNVQTGRLRSSITWQLGQDSLGIYADIGSNVVYAPFVELGTERSRPYPYLRPALSAAGGG